MQGLWGWAWVGVMCSFLWFEATKWVQARECSYSKWLFLMLLLATVVSWYLCLWYSSLLLASLSFLYSAISSASLSLRLISLSSLCSAVSSACLSLRLVSLSSAWLFFASSVSRLSVLLFLLLVFPFALPAIALGLTVVVGHSCTTHYMGITRTRSGSDIVVVIVLP